ncbi:hypothetical protein C8J57DRAFT_1356849 [Mycena rebaudengoi]|nr:hypothetical protein C8J57DRAFT_1356849 [Mycena rebaudengoi]
MDALMMQVEIRLRKTEYARVEEICGEIVEWTVGREGTWEQYAVARLNIATVRVATGASDGLEALRVARGLVHSLWWTVSCDIVAANAMYRAGKLVEAWALLHRCLKHTKGKYAEHTNDCMQMLGDVAYSGSQIGAATEYYVVHLLLSWRMDDLRGKHDALRRLGDIFLVGGDEQTAHTLFSLALEGFTHMDIHRARGGCMFRLGVVWMTRGDRVQARSFWEQARVMFQRSSQQEDVWRCDERLANMSI